MLYMLYSKYGSQATVFRSRLAGNSRARTTICQAAGANNRCALSKAKDKVSQHFGKKIFKRTSATLSLGKNILPDEDQWREFYQRL